MDTSVDRAQRVHFWDADPRVRGIVDNVADAVIGIDVRGSIELFNPAAEQLFGYSAAEVMGRNVKQLAGPEYSSGTMNSSPSTCAPASGTSSALAGRWRDGVRTAPPSPCICRWGR